LVVIHPTGSVWQEREKKRVGRKLKEEEEG
jgi:hypothetical protein